MSDKIETNQADTDFDGTRPKADSPHSSIRGTRRSARSASAWFRGRALALKAGAVAAILTVSMIGASTPTQAASIFGGSAAYLSCGTGSISAQLPTVFETRTAGIIWEITAIYSYNGSGWDFVRWAEWGYASVGAGGSNQGWWTDHRGRGWRNQQLSVAPGYYYALIQYVYADGAWITRMPTGGLYDYPFCYA